MYRAPAIFVSHGAPTFALEPGLLGSRLTDLGKRLASASGIVVVSPHWQTCGIRVTGAAWPSTIHDFGGFPPALYDLTYPAPGSASLAAETAALLAEDGLVAMVDPERGYDHGAWVPLRYLRPDADTPVIQVSMPHNLDTAGALRLGRTLAPLRDRGVGRRRIARRLPSRGAERHPRASDGRALPAVAGGAWRRRHRHTGGDRWRHHLWRALHGFVRLGRALASGGSVG